MDKKSKKEMLSLDTTLQVSDEDNDLGFNMALISNESDKQFKFSATVQYQNLVFMEDDLVGKRSKNSATGITTDTIVGVLHKKERKLLVWKLLKEPWETKLGFVEKKLWLYNEEQTKQDELELITRAFGGLNKKRFNDDIFYSEIENEEDIILVFKNFGRKTYKFNIEFENLENLTVNGDSWTTGATIPLVSDRFYCIKLVKNDKTLPFNFGFKYSYKKITGAM